MKTKVKAKGPGGMAKVEERLSSKHAVLSSNPSIDLPSQKMLISVTTISIK
jgi:hypothetical protein